FARGRADRPAALDSRDARRGAGDRLGTRPAHPDPAAQQLPEHDAIRAGRHRAARRIARPGHDQVQGGGMSTTRTARHAAPAVSRRVPPMDRGSMIKTTVIVVALLFALFVLPLMMSLYYTDTMTQVAIYSIVALGLGLLVGRVGLYSLGQLAVLAIG